MQSLGRLGVRDSQLQTEQKRIILGNQLSLILAGVFSAIAIAQVISFNAKGRPLDFNIYRLLFLIPILLANLKLSQLNYFQIVRFNLVIAVPVTLLLLPAVFGQVPDNDLYWYPYVASVTSLLPQLLLDEQKNKYLYWISMGWLLLFSGTVIELVTFFEQKSTLESLSVIQKYQVIYRVAPVAVFFFISFAILYQRRLAEKYQQVLMQTKQTLESQKELIKRQTEEQLTQNEELKQQREEITAQQDFLELKGREIEESNTLVNQSIDASQQLQQAILPSPSLFEECFDSYAVISQQVSSVATNCYWLGGDEQSNPIFVMVEFDLPDVPGALMTMLTNGLLDQLVQIGGERNAESIHQQLEAKLKEALNEIDQGARELYIGVCSFDQENTELAFASTGIGLLNINSTERPAPISPQFQLMKLPLRAKDSYLLYTHSLFQQLYAVTKGATVSDLFIQWIEECRNTESISPLLSLIQDKIAYATQGHYLERDWMVIGIEPKG